MLSTPYSFSHRISFPFQLQVKSVAGAMEGEAIRERNRVRVLHGLLREPELAIPLEEDEDDEEKEPETKKKKKSKKDSMLVMLQIACSKMKNVVSRSICRVYCVGKATPSSS